MSKQRASTEDRKDGRPDSGQALITFRPRDKCPWKACDRYATCTAADGEEFLPSLAYGGGVKRSRARNVAFRLAFVCDSYKDAIK